MTLRQILDAYSLTRNLRLLVTPPAGGLPPFDGLRAFCVMWVVAFHVYWILGFFTSEEVFRGIATDPTLRGVWNGDLSVDVFFVVSGVLIAGLLMGEHDRDGRIRVGRFYLRRALRLLPSYWLVLGLYCLVPGLPGQDTAWANLLQVNNFVTVTRQCMGWTWSLAIEEHFYLLLPVFLLWVFSRPEPARARWLLAAGAGWCLVPFVVALRAGFTVPYAFYPFQHPEGFARFFDVLYDKSYVRFGAIMFGVGVAYARRSGRFQKALAARPGRATAGALLAISVMIALAWVPTKNSEVPAWPQWLGGLFLGAQRNLFAAAVGYLILFMLSDVPFGAVISRFLSLRIWYPLGQVSYTTYLLHPIVVHAVYTARLRPGAHPGRLELVGYFFADLAIASLISAVIYLLLERPLMNLRPGERAKHRQLAPEPATASEAAAKTPPVPEIAPAA